MSDLATITAPDTGKKCRIEEVFDPSFIELVRLVPRNPYVRALILKMTGIMPGLECASYDQVKEWVEANCTPRPFTRRNKNGMDGGISIQVSFSETEYGRADYSVRCSGEGRFHLGAGPLAEILENAVADGEGIDCVLDRIAEKIDADAWSQCEPDMENNGEFNYDNHDLSGTDDSETTYSTNDIREAVIAFVRERHPELAGELNI